MFGSAQINDRDPVYVISMIWSLRYKRYRINGFENILIKALPDVAVNVILSIDYKAVLVML